MVFGIIFSEDEPGRSGHRLESGRALTRCGSRPPSSAMSLKPFDINYENFFGVLVYYKTKYDEAALRNDAAALHYYLVCISGYLKCHAESYERSAEKFKKNNLKLEN